MASPKIENRLSGIKTNVSLKNYTTFRIGGRAKYFFEAKTTKEIIKALLMAKEFNLPFFIIGQGSNILFDDKNFNALIIKIETKRIQVKSLGNDKKIILVEAGTPLSYLVTKAKELSLTGLEWAAGIPGTVGGAIFGNAGAFGGFMGDLVKSVEVFDVEENKTKVLDQKECHFGYKDSIFKHKKGYIILLAELVLKKGKKQEIDKKIKNYLERRKNSQPFLPSAGCIFKNIEVTKVKNKAKILKEVPEAKKFFEQGFLPAGFLIDKCGLKGKQTGGAKVSEKHANFIVNLGGAKAKDVLKLINSIKQEVKKKFGVELEEEVRIVKTIDTKF